MKDIFSSVFASAGMSDLQGALMALYVISGLLALICLTTTVSKIVSKVRGNRGIGGFVLFLAYFALIAVLGITFLTARDQEPSLPLRSMPPEPPCVILRGLRLLREPTCR